MQLCITGDIIGLKKGVEEAMEYGLLWLAAVVIFIVLEAATNQMICLWFVVGSICAMISSIAGAQFGFQMTIFILVSLISLVCFRRVTLKHIKGKELKTNADGLIGRQILITEDVDNIKGTGQGKINGLSWAVRTESDKELKAGDIATIKRISGVKLIVE